jgi:hypothetical protein
MTPLYVLLAIAACGGIGALIGGMSTYRMSQTHRAAAISIAASIKAVDVKVDAIVRQTDGMTEALVALTDKAAFARGQLDQAQSTDTQVKDG